jgi:shikimate dehydrogenase
MSNTNDPRTTFPRAAVIGWPISHSLSPHIHAFWRQEYGVAGHYFRIPCPPSKEAFDKCTEIMAMRGYMGANVTLPHKLHALAKGTTASEIAMQIGAANMLSFAEGGTHADNSDLYGFAAALETQLDLDDRRDRALIIGAGGAAPAVSLAVQAAGYDTIDITNRTSEKAAQLIRYLSIEGEPVAWENKAALAERYDLIVNTTSLGMAGELALDIDLGACRPETIIVDIVYDPKETDFLRQAREMGLRHMNGLAMLMHQAVPGFEQWFGVRPEVTPALEEHLNTVLASRKKGPVKIGLTGSIGMGKSTVAGFLKEEGAPIWDADDAVHRLYGKGGAAADVLKGLFPAAVSGGTVSRKKLAQHLQQNPGDFPKLEKLIHPLVGADRQAFLTQAEENGDKAVVLDIPLLFETGQQHEYDVVLVVTAAEEVRRKRVLERPGMTEEKFDTIRQRQLPEMEKMMLADHLIFTDKSLSETVEDAEEVLKLVLEKYGR